MRPTLKMLQGMADRAEKRGKARKEAPRGDKVSARLTALFEQRAEIEKALKRLRQLAENGSMQAFVHAAKGAVTRADAANGVGPETTGHIVERISAAEERFKAALGERIAQQETLLRSLDRQIAAAGGPRVPAPGKDPSHGKQGMWAGLRLSVADMRAAVGSERRGAVPIPRDRAAKAPEAPEAHEEKVSGKVG